MIRPLPKPHILSTRILPERGGEVRDTVEDRNNLTNMLECRHLLILVHGFNNTETKATESYQRILANLEEHFATSRAAPDAIAFFHWPGNHAVGPAIPWVSTITDATAYHVDVERAKTSAQRLARFIAGLPHAARSPGSFQLTLIGHSLGCRVILETLGHLTPEHARNVKVVCLLAPAVPVELISYTGRLRATVDRTVLKCFSENDTVLRWAFPLGQLRAVTTEGTLYREAVGLFGNPPDVRTAIQTTNKHGEYWADRELANKFSAAIDPTFYRLPPPYRPPSRSLPASAEIESRPLLGEN